MVNDIFSLGKAHPSPIQESEVSQLFLSRLLTSLGVMTSPNGTSSSHPACRVPRGRAGPLGCSPEGTGAAPTLRPSEPGHVGSTVQPQTQISATGAQAASGLVCGWHDLWGHTHQHRKQAPPAQGSGPRRGAASPSQGCRPALSAPGASPCGITDPDSDVSLTRTPGQPHPFPAG